MNQKKFKISFCIPIYNFGPFVGETIDSILNNISGDVSVEIVVLDGGSTDSTSDVLSSYCKSYKNIKYIKNQNRGGIDHDMDLSVRSSSGEYCWLMSGDDTLRPHAISNFLKIIREEVDIYLCEHTASDQGFGEDEYSIFKKRRPFLVNIAQKKERVNYFESALNTEACFSFMSGVIIRRDLWLSSSPPQKFKGSCWWHVARIFEYTQSKLNVFFVAQTWVNRRGGNDSFLENGIVNRLGLAVNGFHSLSLHYFGANSDEYKAIIKLVRGDLKFKIFLHAKNLCYSNPTAESLSELNQIFTTVYAEKNIYCFIAGIIYFYMPVTFYSFLRKKWRHIKYYLIV